jgi:cytochrome c
MNSLLTVVRFSRIAALFALAAPLPLLLLSAPANSADPNQGQRIFERRCTGCHRLDEVRSGPRLRGVFGRAAGSDPGFPYSSALKSSGLTWNETTLDRWLTDTEKLVPNNDMAFRVSDPDERAEIVAYLKGLSH